MLTKETVATYEKRLEEEKQRLTREVLEHEHPVDFGSDVDAFDEEADEAEELSNELAIAQSLRERVAEIDAALNRIRSGTFGACEKCRAPLDEKILAASPSMRLCAKCR